MGAIQYRSTNGRFIFDGLTRGAYELRCEADGFLPLAVRIRVEDGDVKSTTLARDAASKVDQE